MKMTANNIHQAHDKKHRRKTHSEFTALRGIHARAEGEYTGGWHYTTGGGCPTFRRQELETTCLGSTTSTRGSWTATSRIQLMSKPYTLSHPVCKLGSVNRNMSIDRDTNRFGWQCAHFDIISYLILNAYLLSHPVQVVGGVASNSEY